MTTASSLGGRAATKECSKLVTKFSSIMTPVTKGKSYINDVEKVVRVLLDCSSAPPNQVALLRKGTLTEYISRLEQETTTSELALLLSTILHKVMPITSKADPNFSRIRSMSLEILRNLSRSKHMKHVLFGAPDLVSMLIEVAKKGNGQAFCEKELAIQIVNNLGCDSVIAVELCRIQGLVDELVVCAARGDTFQVREWAIRSLNNMAFAEENQKVLFARKELVRILIHSALHGQTDGIREWCIAALDNLCSPDNHKLLLFGQLGYLDGYVDAVINCATCDGFGESRWALREKGLKALNNIAALPQVSTALFLELRQNRKFERILDTYETFINAPDVIETDHVIGCREAFFGLMLGLSCPPTNHTRLFNQARLLQILLVRIQSGSAVEQEHALGMLMNLAVTDHLRYPLFSESHLVRLVIELIPKGRTVRVKEHGVGLLGNLALDAQAAKGLANEKALLFSLVDGVLQFKGPEVAPAPFDEVGDAQLDENPNEPNGSRVLLDWSRQLLWILGYRNRQFPGIVQKIMALASVYDVPRLGRQSLFRKLLPKDMVREIAARMLVPNSKATLPIGLSMFTED